MVQVEVTWVQRFRARRVQGGGLCCRLLLVTVHRVRQWGLSGALCAYRACRRLKPISPNFQTREEPTPRAFRSSQATAGDNWGTVVAKAC